MKTSIEMLSVALTGAEHQARAHELADALAAVERAEDEEAGRKKLAKARIEKLQHEAYKLRRIVADESEVRPVECSYRSNLDAWTVETWRNDLVQLVTSRPMTADERADAAQGRLFEVEEWGGTPPSPGMSDQEIQALCDKHGAERVMKAVALVRDHGAASVAAAMAAMGHGEPSVAEVFAGARVTGARNVPDPA